MELGIRSAMAAPLWNGDKVDGLICVDTTLLAQAFDSFDLDLLSALGNHVAVAIGQSRLQASVMEQQLARRRLERYHSPAVVERITKAREGSGGLAAEEHDVTVVFAHASTMGFDTLLIAQSYPQAKEHLRSLYEMIIMSTRKLDLRKGVKSK